MGDMAYRYGSDQADSETSFGNAMAQGRGTLINNLIGLGGIAVRGFTPAWKDQTPFGNMASAGASAANNLASKAGNAMKYWS